MDSKGFRNYMPGNGDKTKYIFIINHNFTPPYGFTLWGSLGPLKTDILGTVCRGEVFGAQSCSLSMDREGSRIQEEESHSQSFEADRLSLKLPFAVPLV